MKSDIRNHAAVEFGTWLQEKRRETGVVARVFAGRVGLSPAEYAEVESGILHWINSKHETKIILLLGFDEASEAEFNHKLYLAREAGPLEFSDVFSQEELAPARCCTVDGKQIDGPTREKIIKAVFTPLDRTA